jgi:hypothetical protein
MASGGDSVDEAPGLMGVKHLLNHTADVYRRTETTGAMRSVTVSYAKVSSVRVAVNRPAALLGDAGPGLTPTGDRVMYSIPGWDIRPLDVIVLTSGPDAPGQWEVDGPPTRPRGHHLEIRCRAFVGSI